MSLRRLSVADAAALAGLAATTYAGAFGHSLSAADLAAYVRDNLAPAVMRRVLAEDLVLASEDNGVMTGFIQFGALVMPVAAGCQADGEIRRLYVAADYQQRGIGTQLLQAALAHPRLRQARQVFLDVWERNEGARRLYERHGFVVIGVRNLELESGPAEDPDLIMVRRQ